MLIVIMIVIRIPIPIVLGLPAMFSRVPPLMVLAPTALPFGIQIAPPFVSLVTALAVLSNASIQTRFCFLDSMLAPAAIVIGMRTRYCSEEQKSSCYNCRRC